MAFNALGTFQKHRRFWMAGILIVCMIAFILGPQLLERIKTGGRSRGTTVARFNDPNAWIFKETTITMGELEELKSQRDFANQLFLRAADFAYAKLQAIYFKEKTEGEVKDAKARAQKLIELEMYSNTLALRKSKKYYFDLGMKLDDLIEFRLWQAEADRLGIHLSQAQVDDLFYMESFGVLRREEVIEAQRQALRNHRDVTDAYIQRAIMEEFRVKIAQYAVMGAQPFSYLERSRRGDTILPRLSDPLMPDEIRAPMTPAQIWNAFKTQRSEYEVTLIPIHVSDFVKNIKEPDGKERVMLHKQFFDAHKDYPIDPSSPNWGIEVPPAVRFEYVMADPDAPGFHDVAKALLQLRAVNPIGYDPFSSPITTAARYGAVHQKHMNDLKEQYEKHVNRPAFHPETTPFSLPGASGSIAARLAKQHPEAGASVAVSSFGDPFGAFGAFMAWGALKHPEQQAAAEAAEFNRRAPIYARLFAASTQHYGFDMAAMAYSMDPTRPIGEFMGFVIEAPEVQILPIEAVQHEISNMVTRRTAEEWGQNNIKKLKTALEAAGGDPERFKLQLNTNLKGLKLTHFKKDAFYDRTALETAPELAPFRDAFARSTDMINLFEGRDLKPDRLLKPGDFSKVFFSSESFAAQNPYVAKPWPPEVKPNNDRVGRHDLDPRLIAQDRIDPEAQKRFSEHLLASGTKQAPNLQLYEKAEKPILFWRTGEQTAFRVKEFSQIKTDLEKIAADLAQIEKDLKQAKGDALDELKRTQAELEKKKADIHKVETRISEGWRFEESREKQALPHARDLAQKLAKSLDVNRRDFDPTIGVAEHKERNRSIITMPGVSPMHRVKLGDSIFEYLNYPLPKDRFEYPRDDTVKNVIGIYNLKEPVKIGVDSIDKINKELFDLVMKEVEDQNTRIRDEKFKIEPPGRFVQILTNRPQTIYYVAYVSQRPFMNDLNLMTAFQLAGNQQQARDLFVLRAQQQAGQQMRERYIAAMKTSVDFNFTDEGSARKRFDDGGAGGD